MGAAIFGAALAPPDKVKAPDPAATGSSADLSMAADWLGGDTAGRAVTQ